MTNYSPQAIWLACKSYSLFLTSVVSVVRICYSKLSWPNLHLLLLEKSKLLAHVESGHYQSPSLITGGFEAGLYSNGFIYGKSFQISSIWSGKTSLSPAWSSSCPVKFWFSSFISSSCLILYSL